MAGAVKKHEHVEGHEIEDSMEGRTRRTPKGWGDSGPAGGDKAEEPETAQEPKASVGGRQPGVGRPAGER